MTRGLQGCSKFGCDIEKPLFHKKKGRGRVLMRERLGREESLKGLRTHKCVEMWCRVAINAEKRDKLGERMSDGNCSTPLTPNGRLKEMPRHKQTCPI
ncbi:hypothetical protein Syun_006645 [Stephania yunnanensis]|uniref:Uncharacterized protein n=1 Tax=Stephania yunnanensis TaxID=152371 RepID=A0AAP0L0E4_9MAGN